jgi:hypothetical protein
MSFPAADYQLPAFACGKRKPPSGARVSAAAAAPLLVQGKNLEPHPEGMNQAYPSAGLGTRSKTGAFERKACGDVEIGGRIRKWILKN